MITSGDLTIKATIGELEVIGCGMIHVFEEEKLKIVLDNAITLNFEFLKDDDNKELRASIKASESNKNEGSILIYNFDSSLGQGVLNPMSVGILRNRELYISFFSWNYTDPNNRILNYVFYFGKKTLKSM